METKSILSMDIGYSFTKYASGGILSKFPSIVSKAGSADYIGESTGCDYNGNRYNVGTSFI